MAVRYSGDLKITLKYRDRTNDYRATITWPANARGGYHRHTVYVGSPLHLTHAVDSPDAYDETAHAAISFASEEVPEIGEHAAADASGWSVARNELLAWGGPLHESQSRRRTAASRRRPGSRR